MKPCIKNRLVEKLDMVTYFAPLAAFGIIWKIERQVSYQHCFKNAFFMLVKLYNMKNSILSSNFRFLKNFQKVVLGMWGCRKIFFDTRGCLGTNLDHLGCIRSHLKRFEKLTSETWFWADFATKIPYGMVLSCYEINLLIFVFSL